jgi:site-specific recombinase XerD
VRRLAYTSTTCLSNCGTSNEPADTGILSPELAAGIQRVKGAKRLGVRLGNWLTVEECRAVLAAADVTTLAGCRDRAMLSLVFGCGLRRAELVALELRDLQPREDHWVLVDLIGKGKHIRTVPVPDWVQAAVAARRSSAIDQTPM